MRKIINLGFLFICTLFIGGLSLNLKSNTNLERNDKYIEVDAEEMIELPSNYTSIMNAWWGFPIKGVSSEENSSFDFSVEGEGTFSFYGLTKNTTAISGYCVQLSQMIRLENETIITDISQSFIKIILRKDNNILGYALVEILEEKQDFDSDYCMPEPIYVGKVVVSKKFPKIDDKFQEVTDEYINSLFDSLLKPNK